MNRRSVLALLAATPLAAQTAAARGWADEGAAHPVAAAWEAWKDAHLDESGRVIDRLQGLVSHSEGQGYGMTLAERMGDQPAFEAMFRWTEENLAVRPDALLAWRWAPDAPNPVADSNNASDGDLFYAWALMRAAVRFDRPEWHSRAEAITRDLEAKCVVDFPGHTGAFLFLPGAFGFELETGYVINPSYYMLRAMEDLGKAYGAPRLVTAAANGDVLLAELARMGPVPDWVEVTESGLSRSEQFSANSGYEALRVPLWMIWSRKPEHPALTTAFRPETARELSGELAATVVDYKTGAVLETSTEPGYRAVSSLAACMVQNQPGSAMPPFDPEQTYYPGTLHLFAFLAQIEVTPECFPL
ncbi:putative endoglucanase precursor [Rhodobacteraceae bacterium THAF1]|uniref:glycosyl hydrolase family 8 n=1 Tax=Palleronia sp. THAF1 TaxID=2587842 RepID=UPI000F3D6149|nr:glycosyl hydrolase family 8 [Palleronia sp. THAF1]QFU09778.1 putative endoglucanase precursor [Palleronia sp. THAF1]VDC17319.1 putative endoglucanase precursor [Rhodobacteraceae bacterium THAF1]